MKQPLDHPWRNGFPAREPDGTAYHGPQCRCGSRATQRVEGKYLVRKCSKCGGTYYYRIFDGLLLPFDRDTAQMMDEERGARWGEVR